MPIVDNTSPTESKISNVNATLFEITHQDVVSLLDAKHDADPVVGIVIAALDGIEVVSDHGYKYHFHAARVFTSNPDTPNFVNPHYHLKGEEPYNILNGEAGEINLGKVVDGKVEWRTPRTVKTGDFIEVQEGEVHSLRNNGSTPLDFTFACPDEHLVDNSVVHPEGDRYLTKALPNGIPSHYLVKA